MSGKVLFACSKCFSRHPFEELSSGQQLCKNCRSSSYSAVVKCIYCRSEHQQTNKSSVCKKCEQSLKQYGKPSACECCNIIAAFGGPKCQRCSSYEAKYGQPVTCDECKMRSAFDKHDENKKVNGKLLCWLCTCAYKRALVKAHQEGRLAKKRPHEKQSRDSSKKSQQSRSEMSKNSASLEMPDKIQRGNASSGGGGSGGNGGAGGGRDLPLNVPIVAPAVVSVDPNSSDHVVAMTELKERIASLERKLIMKDKDLLEKDKQLTELKGINFEKENEMRNKLKENDRIHEMKVDQLNQRIANLLKEVATLKRGSKKNGTSGGKEKDKESGKDSGGSGTESPITN